MTTHEIEEARTLAEALGMTDELAEAIARVAADELGAGRPDPARVILEGLVVANPRAVGAWMLLARVHRALGQPLAARFCAEVAGSLAPGEATDIGVYFTMDFANAKLGRYRWKVTLTTDSPAIPVISVLAQQVLN